MMEKLDYVETNLFRGVLGYFWPLVCHNEELYPEMDMLYRWMTREKRQNLAPPEVVMENRLRFFGHVTRRPSDRLVQVVLRMLPDPNWKRPPGRKRKLWMEMVKEDLRTLGVDWQFSRDVKFCRLWNSDGWVDSMRITALKQYFLILIYTSFISFCACETCIMSADACDYTTRSQRDIVSSIVGGETESEQYGPYSSDGDEEIIEVVVEDDVEKEDVTRTSTDTENRHKDIFQSMR
ncbi:hypothetical protein RB195_023598 [Necator americanus]|uniref:Uncharacterized protein n=1 Tax=Necator americanus TaxID=51031 RepID=A0ABR1EJT9_NECAM